MDTATSEIFSIPAKAYAAARARRYAGAWATALALPLIAALIAGFYDMRWWFVGLMALFILYPMMLTMAWFTLTGSPAMALLLRPQRWTFNGDKSIYIEFFHFDTEEHPEPVDRRTVTVRDVASGGRFSTVKAAPNQQFDILLIPSGLVPPEFLNICSE